jgi:predicted amidohydrolase YtcJ
VTGEVICIEARSILTMNRANPYATHIAIQGKKIVAVGNEAECRKAGATKVLDCFRGGVVLPGFVEAHSHAMEGVIWRFVYCGFDTRTNPQGERVKGAATLSEILARLADRVRTRSNSGQHDGVAGWGFDSLVLPSEALTRKELDKVSLEIPIGVIHQSLHIITANSALLRRLDILRPDISHPGIPLDTDGLPTGELRGPDLLSAACGYIGLPQELLSCDQQGLIDFNDLCKSKGVTTATDLANPLSDKTVSMMLKQASEPEFGITLVSLLRSQGLSGEAMVERAVELHKKSTQQMRFGKIKLVVDGSIQGFTARMRAPGYFNGAPNGLWYLDKNLLFQVLFESVRHQVQVHIHTNGDEATELVINTIESVLKAHPKCDHRFVIQHCQLADPLLLRRMSELGISANFFANHLYFWGDEHWQFTLGPERTQRMNPCKTAAELGVAFSIHSDAPVTPLDPLFTAWCSVTRTSRSDRVIGPDETITREQALHAITLGAAHTLKMENEIGSLEVGKQADFVVLDHDPLDAKNDLRQIQVVKTIHASQLSVLLE